MGRSVGSGYVIIFIFTVHLLGCVRVVWVKFGANSFTGSGDIAVFLKKTCSDSDNPGHKFLPNRCHYESVVNDRSCHPPPAPLQPPSQCWMWSLVASEAHPTLRGGWEGVGVCGGSRGGAGANLESIARCACSGWVIIAIFFVHIPLCVDNQPIKFH